MLGSSPLKPYIWPVVLSVLGMALSAWIIPRELIAVDEHILGFPDTDIAGHRIRPLLLGLLCMLPAIGAWL